MKTKPAFKGWIRLAITALSLAAGSIHAESPAAPEKEKDPEVEKMLKIGVPEDDKSAKPGNTAKSELPRVLLIGDSISGGYLGAVSTLLKGKAVVARGNSGGPSTAGLQEIERILEGGPWDVIHFNWGLHDMTWQFKMKEEEKGIPAYKDRLEKLVQRLEKTGAQLIWATTTPWCPETYGYAAQRYKQELKYSVAEQLEWKNATLEVMEKHGIQVNDLHALLLPELDKYLGKPDDIHFNRLGSQTMAGQIAKEVLAALEKPKAP